MAGLLSGISSFFSSGAGKGLETILGLGATGAGLTGNLLADRQRSAAASQAQKNMNLTPQQLAAQVSAAEQPLNKSLVQDVTGNVDANLAEQGLSQSPGLIAQATSQALAPFQQQNQQTAMQLVLQRLGLPAEFLKTIPPNAPLGPLLALLMKGGNFGTPGAAPTSGYPATQPNIMQLTGGANPMPSGIVPSTTDWLGNLSNAPPPDMPPPDVGGGF